MLMLHKDNNELEVKILMAKIGKENEVKILHSITETIKDRIKELQE